MKQRCLKFTYLVQYDVKPYLNTFCLNNFAYEIESNTVKKTLHKTESDLIMYAHAFIEIKVYLGGKPFKLIDSKANISTAILL